jgi:hypothetical protein
MASTVSRRTLLQTSVRIAIATVAAGELIPNAVSAEKVCADPSSMDSDAKSLRGSLHYVEISPDTTKTCSMCGFFQPAAEGCGTCQIFSGPANTQGHCDSWSRKS